MCLGSIYGPNLDENILIYDQIEQKVIEQECESIILGGDWNCTWDCPGVDSNIDVLDMASIPSKNRSERLKKLCNKLKLTDPYRVFLSHQARFHIHSCHPSKYQSLTSQLFLYFKNTN